MDDNSPSSSDTDEWEERARELHEKGGLSEQRARIAALLERGYSHSEIASMLGLSSRGSVYNQVREVRETLRESQWLASELDLESETDPDTTEEESGNACE